MATKVCWICHREFETPNSAKYCSKECRLKALMQSRENHKRDNLVETLAAKGLAPLRVSIRYETKVELEKAAARERTTVSEIVNRILDIGIALNTYTDYELQ